VGGRRGKHGRGGRGGGVRGGGREWIRAAAPQTADPGAATAGNSALFHTLLNKMHLIVVRSIRTCNVYHGGPSCTGSWVVLLLSL
jgi:hypothetical protein